MLSSLTYAALSQSVVKTDIEGEGVFEAMCDVLQKERLLNEELLLPTNVAELKITPLAAAAFQGNPGLFNKILQKHMGCNGHRWKRGQVTVVFNDMLSRMCDD